MSESEQPTGTGVTDVETDKEPLLEIRGLKKHFDLGGGFLDKLLGQRGSVRAVDDVDLDVYKGEIVAIVGESGCGKSTLARTILNLDDPTAGDVRYKGEDIAGIPEKEMRSYRKQMQMIFQEPGESLNPKKTVGSILTAPLKVHGIGDDKEEREEIAKGVLEDVGLEPSHYNRHPRQFSGGQQQRIGLARALILEPDLLVADEPVSKLDVSVQAQILNRLSGLQSKYELSMIFIAHNLSVVRHIADRVAVMYLGKIVEVAPVEELFENPQHPYTQSLLSAVPRIDPDAGDNRILLEGSVPSPINPPAGCRFHTRCPAVIPPASWDYDQETFKAAFTYRVALENEELEIDSIRSRLESEGREPSDENAVEYLLEHRLTADISELPTDVVETLRSATREYVDGDRSDATDRLREEFSSPCVDDEPAVLDTDTDHKVACHRLDPEMSAEPLEGSGL